MIARQVSKFTRVSLRGEILFWTKIVYLFKKMYANQVMWVNKTLKGAANSPLHCQLQEKTA